MQNNKLQIILIEGIPESGKTSLAESIYCRLNIALGRKLYRLNISKTYLADNYPRL